jgi:hypothetical protein
MEKLSKAKEVPNKTMHSPGANTQYHMPFKRAFAFCAQ